MNLKHTRLVPGTVTFKERLEVNRRSKTVLNVFREHANAESANPRIYDLLRSGIRPS